MTLSRAVLGIAGIPLLGGCMAGGWGHTGVPAGTYVSGHMGPGWTVPSSQRAEGTGDGLSIVLLIPAPTAGTVGTIAVQLRSGPGDPEPADAEIRLRIEGPVGSVDDLPMQRERSSGAWTYQAQYGFAVPGRYVVTAEARFGAGTDVRTVSVTTGAEVGAAREYRHDWSVPVFVGGLGMVAMMVFMMAS